MKLREYVDDSTIKVRTDNFCFKKLKSGLSLTNARAISINSVLLVLSTVEEARKILGGDRYSEVHVQYVVIASTIKKCQVFKSQTQPGSVTHELANLLKLDVLHLCAYHA